METATELRNRAWFYRLLAEQAELHDLRSDAFSNGVRQALACNPKEFPGEFFRILQGIGQMDVPSDVIVAGFLEAAEELEARAARLS
jgi:hypothetical protein